MNHKTILICEHSVGIHTASARAMMTKFDQVTIVDSLPGATVAVPRFTAPEPIMITNDRLTVNDYSYGPYKDGMAARRERRQKQRKRNGNII